LALGALGVAALHLAGDPQWVVAAVLIGALLAFDAQRWTGLVRAAAAVALGTGLAAIQLVPAWFAFAEMGRAGGLSAVDRVQWALSPWRIIELALPGLFGAPGEDAGIFLWLGGPNRDWVAMPFVPSVAVGATTLVLALPGAAANRTGRALAAAAGVLLWLALGTRGGAEQLLHSVPVWGSFRYAEKLVGPLTLSLAVLAALGLDTVRQGALQGRWKWVPPPGERHWQVPSRFRAEGSTAPRQACPRGRCWPRDWVVGSRTPGLGWWRSASCWEQPEVRAGVGGERPRSPP
jgi:hypothetical protein